MVATVANDGILYTTCYQDDPEITTMDSTSDFLFTKNSFLVGAGSAFDLWGDYFLYNYSRNGTEADARAIASDWRVVGKDIANARRQLEKAA